tara:strand:+ start:833 stop:1309 length:477 start_codon:yes stop_codon:yes gene_type:complete
MTESGKTTLAKKLAAHYQSKGIGVLVLDPMGDPDWPCDYRTSDVSEFLDVFWQSRKCAVFIDEAGEAVGQFDKVMQKTATKGRHWGHSCHYLSQRGAQIARTVRDQCSHLFLFTTSLDDSKVHSNEWNKPELKSANGLVQGHYYHATRFGNLSKNQLW